MYLSIVVVLVIALFGYITNNPGVNITNNPVFNIILEEVIVCVCGIILDAAVEEIKAKGPFDIGGFFAKVLEVLKWVQPAVGYAILIIVLVMVLAHPFVTAPETHAKACIQTPLRLFCRDGVEPIQVTIDSKGQLAKNGSLITIGIVDEKDSCIQNKYQTTYTPFDQFDATNATEKDLVDRILKENCEQADATEHFTLILATTLSRTVTDNGFSISVGLEELRGAYLAQHDYNQEHKVKKLRLLVANLGTKDAAQVAAPLVAAQIALYSKNCSDNDHFIGAVGFPFSITAKQALPILQQNNVQVIGSSPSSEQLSNEPGFYRVEPSDKQQSAALKSFILNILQSKKVVVLYDQRSPENGGDPYSNSLGENVIASLSASVSVTPLDYTVGQPATLPLQQILDSKPDLLFFAGYPDDLSALKEMLKRKQRQGIALPENMRIMGAQALYELGGYTNGNYANLVFTTFAFPDVKAKDASIDFQAEYRNTFDPSNEYPGEYGYQRAGPHSALAYDAVAAFTTAVQKTSGPLSADKIKSELTNLPFNGATGLTIFNGKDAVAPSDPTGKLLYLVCTNKDGLTQELAEYDKGNLEQKAQLDVCV